MVPCKLSNNEYIALFRPERRNQWTPEEDHELVRLIRRRGSKRWTVISSELNERVHNGENVRLAKQCRERWICHLNPDLNKGPWTPDEDKILEDLVG